MVLSTDTNSVNFTDVLERCAGGDRDAFRMVVEQYQGYVFALAFRLVNEEEEAKDIVQESFIRVWNNLRRYNPDIKFTTWMYTIVTNLCYDSIRSRKRKRMAAFDTIDSSVLENIACTEDPEHILTNQELGDIIRMLTEELPPKQKLVFVLRDIQGLNILEVCDILRMSESSVKTNLVYARRFLRDRLDKYLKP